MNYFVSLLCVMSCCFVFQLNAQKTLSAKAVLHTKSTYDDLNRNPYMSSRERKKIQPFLLPLEHPIKSTLDAIFMTQRATLDTETLVSAGFDIKFHQPRSHIKVASHPLMPGFLFKILLDTEVRIKDEVPGWQWFVNRVTLANKIRKFIKNKQIKHFIVPKKWIYPLPLEPSIPENTPNYIRKNEILVVEEMLLASSAESTLAWKTVITKEHLEEFYAIIQHCGGASYRPDNVAYTLDGRFAFIDTEYANHTAKYWDICKYLSEEMAAYWHHLYDDIL